MDRQAHGEVVRDRCLRMAGVLIGALAIPVQAGQAQPAALRPPMTSMEALAALPDPEGYSLQISGRGLSPQAQRDLSRMLTDTIGKDHFFGAIYAYLPEGTRRLSIHMRRKLHSPEAAERVARADCEAARRGAGSECYQLGRIAPKGWTEGNGPMLSHEAMYAFSRKAGEMEGPKFVARSRGTTAWAMWSGENSRQKALNECNDAVRKGGFPPDCDLVIADAG